MLKFEQILLVRHGHYGRRPIEELTEKGKAQSEKAYEELVRHGVGRTAILLSSTAPRALQTAAIIGAGLSVPVKPSERMNIIGNSPDGVASLDDMLEAALAEAEVSTEGDALVVVAHQPLLEVTASGAFVDNGEVVSYVPGSWNNPRYQPYEEEYLEQRLDRAGLPLRPMGSIATAPIAEVSTPVSLVPETTWILKEDSRTTEEAARKVFRPFSDRPVAIEFTNMEGYRQTSLSLPIEHQSQDLALESEW